VGGKLHKKQCTEKVVAETRDAGSKKLAAEEGDSLGT
jgi:hypothetical protein